MPDAPIILVIGGGPAGVSAAVSLARLNGRVLLVEQRDRLGGAIHRQPCGPDVPSVPRAARHVRTWKRLLSEVKAFNDRIRVLTSTVFIGLDGSGHVLLDKRRTGDVVAIRPDGLVLALGAVERIIPFPGWELPGVVSAGGVQMLLKETGHPLPGTTLVAGTGPLLLAVGAQLCAAGRPPEAILERGRPLARFVAAAAATLGSIPHAMEGFGYATRLAGARVPYLTGSHVVSCVPEGDELSVTVSAGGTRKIFHVRGLIVHDGVRADRLDIRPGDAPFPVVEAGDGREILGADAAVLDGCRAATSLAGAIGMAVASGTYERRLAAAGRFQRALAKLFAAPQPALPPETILCRCEGKRVADLPAELSPREIKLVSRFGMGVCQGRFCAESTAHQIGAVESAGIFRSGVSRWPTRPVSAGALARLKHNAGEFERIWNDEHCAAP